MPQKTPYFFDGRLHIPNTILNKLILSGLSVRAAETIRKGVELDDSETIQHLAVVVHQYIQTHPHDDPIAVALRDREFQFMLGGYAAGV